MPTIKSLKKGLQNFLQDRKEPLEIPRGDLEKLSLGKSIQGRKIIYYSVGNGVKKILFVSAMHGNEIGTIKLAYRLIDHLRGNENKYKELTCFMLPCLNPDGFETAKSVRGHFKIGAGRLNAGGVDLNRNFPAPNFRQSSHVLPRESGKGALKYRREISPDSTEAENFGKKSLPLKNCGRFGGSEPETKALIDFIEKEGVSVVFSFHNTGRDVTAGRNFLSKELAEIFAGKTGYDILEEDGWRKIGQTGTLKDWCDERDIAFLEVEGSTRYGSDWKIQKPALEAILDYVNIP